MIYEQGFVHSDPHPGNIFVRKCRINGREDIQVVLLDHGLYTNLTTSTRLSYTKLWRGIMTQNEGRIREASMELGADFYELFTSMIVNRKYEEVMEKKDRHDLKARLGERQDQKSKDAIRDYALYYHKDIVEILDLIKRELLLILKTNNYLRAIDKRLGNPVNTYNIINNITWKIYCNEVAFKAEKTNTWEFMKETTQYYFIRLLLYIQYMRIRFFGLFGVKASDEELQDFELDYNE